MRYIISDIHGCYAEYKEMLDRIDLSEEDELYILGDAMDRGPEPIKVMQDIMLRPNVTYIIGNHDYMMYECMKELTVEITEETIDSLSAECIWLYSVWMQNGGEVTAKQFGKLSREEQQDMLAYLEESETYEVVENDGKKFILVHAGLDNFSEDKPLEDYDIYELIEDRPDYSKRYYSDKNTYVVTGHTPTCYVNRNGEMRVYQENGHIAIDCGCVFGGRLAAYCIETGETVYVESMRGKV